jgi:hypothetical protein
MKIGTGYPLTFFGQIPKSDGGGEIYRRQGEELGIDREPVTA